MLAESSPNWRTGPAHASKGHEVALLYRPGDNLLLVPGEPASLHSLIRAARVFDTERQRRNAFAKELSCQLNMLVETAESPSDALRDVDIVCTATTAREPVFNDLDVPPGVHINAVGAYSADCSELPPATVQRARVVVDHLASAMEEAGDLLRPLAARLIEREHLSTELGHVLSGERPGRCNAQEITIFKSEGIAIQETDNPMACFAEASAALFSVNDFFQFTGDDLQTRDLELFTPLVKSREEEPPRRPTAIARQQAPVDFSHPPRDYKTRRLKGWEVLIDEQLANEAPELATSAVGRLETKLGEIAAILPANSLPELRRVKVFLLHGPQAKAGGRENGLEYFRAEAPQHWGWLDARMASSIVIFNAANYVRLTDQWALKSLLHEFGHAQHLEHWPEDRADIYDTWQDAMKGGLYQAVREEDKTTHNPNYASQNHLEYFAELTTTYFAGNTYFPYDRAALNRYDPAGHALIERLWGIPKSAGAR